VTVSVLHISDAHFKASMPLPDAQQLARDVASAIAPAIESSTAVAIAFTGDVAYSGLAEEYAVADAFLETLISTIEATSSKRPSVHISPGNHDTLLPDPPDAVRAMLLTGVANDPTKLEDPQVQAALAVHQAPFFSFLRKHSLSPANQLFWESTAGDIAFSSLNLAITSRRREDNRKLFPISVIAPPACSLSVALMHHPLTWLEPDSSRELRDHLIQKFFLVLTGHEHTPSGRSVATDNDDNAVFIEGGVLSGDGTHSTFNLLRIDTATESVERLLYSRESPADQYSRKSNPALTVPHLSERRGRFLDSTFRDELLDPGFPVDDLSAVNIDKLFIFPNLSQMPSNPDEPEIIIPGREAFDAIRQSKSALITGDSRSGKSTLGRAMFLNFYRDNYVPLLLNGGLFGGAQKEDQLRRYLDAESEKQYQSSATPFTDVPASQRVVIVDNFSIGRNPQVTAQHLRTLQEENALVILLADEMALSISQIRAPIFSGTFTRFRIQAATRSARSAYIKRYHQCYPDPSVDPQRRHDNAVRIVEQVLGNNLVPAYYQYIAAILVALRSATPVDTTSGTNGYFYELFIRNRLAQGRSKTEYDILISFSVRLAREIDRNGGLPLSMTAFQEAAQTYISEYDLSWSHESLLRELRDAKVLSKSQVGDISFCYDYQYYYFLALQIRDTLSSPETREKVENLCSDAHQQNAANTLLFLAHVSKDPFIVESLIKRATNFFPDLQPASFDRSERFADSILASAPEASLLQGSPSDGERVDLVAPPPDAPPEDLALTGDDLALIHELSSALKTIQVLGQLLRNFPGSIDGATKTRILETCCDLGFKCFARILKLLEDEQTEILRSSVSLFRITHPAISEREVLTELIRVYGRLLRLAGIGVVKRVATAVGSDELQKTFDRLTGSIGRDLVSTSILLDFFEEFPEKKVLALSKRIDTSGNAMARWILKDLIVMHLYLYEVGREEKQRVCQQLDIKFEKLPPRPIRS
jgi:hypothetical protein